MGGSCLVEVVISLTGVTQTEFLDGGIVESALTEISQADVLTHLGLMQLFLKIITSPLVKHEHGFALGLLLFFLVGQFLLMDLDMVFTSKVAQRLGIAQLLVFHDEIDRASSFSTGKALADAFGT